MRYRLLRKTNINNNFLSVNFWEMMFLTSFRVNFRFRIISYIKIDFSVQIYLLRILKILNLIVNSRKLFLLFCIRWNIMYGGEFSPSRAIPLQIGITVFIKYMTITHTKI